MASGIKSLSNYSSVKTSLFDKRIGVLVSDYHQEITFSLRDAAIETFIKEGGNKKNIFVEYAPGAFELPLAAQLIAKKRKLDAVICLGCVVKGDTMHFDFICNAVAQGITNVSLNLEIPVIFGVLTPNNYQQALDRAGGKHGNKGVEAAAAAIGMLL